MKFQRTEFGFGIKLYSTHTKLLFQGILPLARLMPPLVPAISHPSKYFKGRLLADTYSAPKVKILLNLDNDHAKYVLLICIVELVYTS